MSIVTPYEDLLRFVLETGTPKSDRTGTGTRSLFGQQMRYDLSAGFPLLTTKKVHFKSVAYELLWFLARRFQYRLAARARSHHLGRMGK